jgi:hypothetical protein
MGMDVARRRYLSQAVKQAVENQLPAGTDPAFPIIPLTAHYEEKDRQHYLRGGIRVRASIFLLSIPVGKVLPGDEDMQYIRHVLNGCLWRRQA